MKGSIILYGIFNFGVNKAYDFTQNINFAFHQPHFEYPSDMHQFCISVTSSQRRSESKRKINTSFKYSIIINGSAICVDKPTRHTNSYKCSIFCIVWLYMFRTITCSSSRAPSSKLYHAFGTFVQASLAAAWYSIIDSAPTQTQPVLPTTT